MRKLSKWGVCHNASPPLSDGGGGYMGLQSEKWVTKIIFNNNIIDGGSLQGGQKTKRGGT